MKNSINLQNDSFSCCSSLCLFFCKNQPDEIPINRRNTEYKIISKTRNRGIISFPHKILGTKMDFLLTIPISRQQKELKTPFCSFSYDTLPRNQLMILEKYPYYIASKIQDVHLKLSFEQNDFNLRLDINNSELCLENLLDVFFFFLQFKMEEICNNHPNFCFFVQIPREPHICELKSLKNFSDFFIKYDDNYSIHNRKFFFDKMEKFKKALSISSNPENKSEPFRFLNKLKDKFEEKDLILGSLPKIKSFKSKIDVILINFFQTCDKDNLNFYKEVLIKKMYKSLNLAKSIVILFHKSFSLDRIAEIFDKSWSSMKEEPKNFSIEIELLYINNIFEGYFVYWGQISNISYHDIQEFLFNTLYKPVLGDFTSDISIKQQKSLLEEKFLKHGLRIFQKIVFAYKNFEKINDEDLLYNLLFYLLNNNILSFHDVKCFSCFEKIITSSLKSVYSRRRVSHDSNNRLNSNEDNNSSYNDNSVLFKDKRQNTNDLNQESIEDFEKRSSNYLVKRNRIRTEIKRQLSFKTLKGDKSKDMIKNMSKEFNLSSLDSEEDLQFSSYSGDLKDSEESEFMVEKLKNHHYTFDEMNRLYKNSWSFSFE